MRNVEAQARAHSLADAVGKLDNRPLHRALHGLALALWRLRDFPAAELVVHNMLWLNPADNQGASSLLPAITQRRAWEDHDGP